MAAFEIFVHLLLLLLIFYLCSSCEVMAKDPGDLLSEIAFLTLLLG